MSLTRQAGLVRANALFEEMESELTHTLRQEGISGGALCLTRSFDMRYKGQFHIINVTGPKGTVTEATLQEAEEAFHAEHQRLYTFASRGDPTEIVNLRVRGIGKVSRPGLRRLEPGEAKDAYKGTRQVYFREADGFLDTQIYYRERLGAGSALEGPAVIEERTSTTLVPKGFNAKVDDYGNITLRRSP